MIFRRKEWKWFICAIELHRKVTISLQSLPEHEWFLQDPLHIPQPLPPPFISGAYSRCQESPNVRLVSRNFFFCWIASSCQVRNQVWREGNHIFALVVPILSWIEEGFQFRVRLYGAILLRSVVEQDWLVVLVESYLNICCIKKCKVYYLLSNEFKSVKPLRDLHSSHELFSPITACQCSWAYQSAPGHVHAFILMCNEYMYVHKCTMAAVHASFLVTWQRSMTWRMYLWKNVMLHVPI